MLVESSMAVSVEESLTADSVLLLAESLMAVSVAESLTVDLLLLVADSLLLDLVVAVLLVLVAVETVLFAPWLLSFEACSQVADAKLSLLVADVVLLLLLQAADATKL